MQVIHERLLFFMYALIRKCLLIHQIMIILGGGVVQLVKASSNSDCKVADLMSVLVNYLTGTLCGVKD